jgi:hypothetical protein
MLLGVVLFSGLASGQDRSADQERAIAAIKKLGGRVTVDPKKPGAPVAVALTGASSPADCLPHLKDVGNLQTCDL